MPAIWLLLQSSFVNNVASAGLLLVFLILSASAWAWWRALTRLAAGTRLLAFEPRTEPPWALLDLLLAFFLMFGCQLFAAGVLAARFRIRVADGMAGLSVNAQAAVLLAVALATLAAFLLSVAAVRLRTGASGMDLGIDRTCLMSDLQLGGVAFLMLAPIVYGIQMVLVLRFESKHPLIVLLQEDPDPKFFVLSGVAALLVAPLAEEYFFRVLLQGWLERVAARDSSTTQLLLGGRPGNPEEDPAPLSADGLPPLPTEPYASPTAQGSYPHSRDGQRSAASWPILGSAFVFALLHYSHGPDPIPLFVLAVGLGYLYRQTHRVLPCIVVHFLLNSCSLGALCLSVYFGE